MWVNHTTTKNLNPSSVLTEAAALTATDVTADIHLCAWLSEWEIAWTKTNLCISTKHLTRKGEKHLL